ncbi:MAG: ADOP family duplicated permease [Acidobacteriota bacterium]
MTRRRPFWYLRRRSVMSDVDEELNLHLDLRIEELIAEGLSAQAARAEALRQFGDLEATRRYCRQQDEEKETVMQRTLLLKDLADDVRIGCRSLLRAPVLTLTIIVTVGLGLGATAAIFSAISAALLRPLPYAEPERLVRLYTDTPPFKFRFSVVDYLAFTEQQTRFERSATYTDRAVTFTNGDTAELLQTRVVSWGFFAVLGITPTMGRDFAEEDGRLGSPQVAVAAHAFWQQRLGGRADAIGRPVRLDGVEYTLIGVLPASDGPLERRYDLFLIQQFTPPTRKGPFLYSAIARLPRGADRALAISELHAINRALFPVWESSYQDDKSTWNMEDLKTNLVGDVSALAGLALAAVGLVWLIACANASNLLIARLTSRRTELAVRAALGASRGRLLRYLLAESVLLASGAVALGAGLAWAGMQLLQAQGATYFPRTQEIRFDAAMMWLMAGLGISSALIFGLVPALHGTPGPADAAMRSGRTVTGGAGARRLRRGLVAAQFAITLPLLISAALLLDSLDRLRQVDLGFDTGRVLTGSIRLPAAQYGDNDRVNQFWDELKRKVEGLPEVASVAFSNGLPPNNVGDRNNFDLEQSPTPPGQSQPITPWVAVTPEYVRTLGLTLVEGRLLDEHDARRDDLLSIMVDRAWARRFFPNQSAVGQRLRGGGCTTCPWTSVVGVVSQVKYAGLDRPDDGTVYTPLAGSTSRFIVVRTHGDPSTITAALQQVVRELEPSAPVSRVASMTALVDQSLARPQSLSLLVTSFASVALLLSVIGIYGVMGYYVQQHLKEIGIRMALGGSRADVARLVIGQGMTVVGVGTAVGLGLALASTRLMAGLLFGVGASDPLAYAMAGALLLVVAVLACAVPALRAMRLQPATVLRNQ